MTSQGEILESTDRPLLWMRALRQQLCRVIGNAPEGSKRSAVGVITVQAALDGLMRRGCPGPSSPVATAAPER